MDLNGWWLVVFCWIGAGIGAFLGSVIGWRWTRQRVSRQVEQLVAEWFADHSRTGFEE